MSKRESPQTQVRRRVRDAAKAKLDRVNDLMDHNFAQLEFLLRLTVVAVSAAIDEV